LEKLFPQAYRVYLPDISARLDDELTLLPYENAKEEDCLFYPSIAQAVTAPIYDKTRYLFYHTQGTISYIVPRNLRELRRLIYLLYTMSAYTKQKETTENTYNQYKFKKYFFETWVENNLDDKRQKIVQEILKITDATLINKTVISLLKERFENLQSYYDEKDKGKNEDKDELYYILRPQNIAYNVSVGDVMAVMDYIEKRNPSDADQKLLFFIRSLYSIKLYEYYNERTEPKTDSLKNTMLVLPEETIFSDINNLEKLVGGNYINSKIVNLVQDEQGTKNNRAFRRVDISVIREDINNSLSIINSNKIVEIELKDALNGTTPKDIAIQKLKVAEFFALTSSRVFNTKYERYNLPYREYKELYYAERFSVNREVIYFDLASLFFNILDIEKAYNRIDPALYDWANGNGSDSLYGKIKNRYDIKERNKKKDVKDHGLVSYATIRNAEVLKYLSSTIEHYKNDSGSSVDKILSDFFQKVSNFKIKTYDKNDKEEWYYSIDFKFLEEIKPVFENKFLLDYIDEIFKDNKDSIFKDLYFYQDVMQLSSSKSLPLSIDLTSDEVMNRFFGSEEKKNAGEIKNVIWHMDKPLFEKIIKSIADKYSFKGHKKYSREDARPILSLIEKEVNELLAKQNEADTKKDKT
jgi:hypothetical protein